MKVFLRSARNAETGGLYADIAPERDVEMSSTDFANLMYQHSLLVHATRVTNDNLC